MKNITTLSLSILLVASFTNQSLFAQETKSTSLIENKNLEVNERLLKDYITSFNNTVVIKQIENYLSFNKKTENSRNIPRRQEVIEIYGEPDYVIEGSEIVAKEENWSSGLYSVLMFNFQDKITIKRNIRTKRLEARAVRSFKRQKTFIIVDGIVVPKHSHYLVEYIVPSDVISFEVIEQIKPTSYQNLFFQTFFRAPTRAPFIGNVIAIYTKTGKGIYEVPLSYEEVEEEVTEE